MRIKSFLLLLLITLIGTSNAYAIAETVRMHIGDTRTLAPSELPSKVLAGQPTWTTSRPNDIQIISTDMYTCTIKAINSFSGFATVHCQYYYREMSPTSGQYIYQRSGYKDYNVFVEGKKQPSSIKIYPTDITMERNESKAMTVTIYPSDADQTVTWNSSNSSIASVNSNNTLYANGYGKTTITATTSNGLSASCYVTVENATIEPTNISIPDKKDLAVNSSINITPTITPSNATTTLTWKSDNPSVATVSSSGVIKGVSAGTACIKVSTSNGLSASCIVTVKSGSQNIQDYDDAKIKRAVERIKRLKNSAIYDLKYLQS